MPASSAGSGSTLRNAESKGKSGRMAGGLVAKDDTMVTRVVGGEPLVPAQGNGS